MRESETDYQRDKEKRREKKRRERELQREREREISERERGPERERAIRERETKRGIEREREPEPAWLPDSPTWTQRLRRLLLGRQKVSFSGTGAWEQRPLVCISSLLSMHAGHLDVEADPPGLWSQKEMDFKVGMTMEKDKPLLDPRPPACPCNTHMHLIIRRSMMTCLKNTYTC